MYRDNSSFRNRFLRWKLGELVYENGRPLPTYEDGKNPHPRPIPHRKGEIVDGYDRLSSFDQIYRQQEIANEQNSIRNQKAADEFNRNASVVIDALTKLTLIPFTGDDYREAIKNQVRQKLDKAQDYKNVAESMLSLAELGFSGAGLLGAYSNYKKWAQSASVAKKTIANLLQRVLLPSQVGGTLIDAIQAYNAVQNGKTKEAIYNTATGILGIIGSLGASDVFLRSSLHSPKIDRVLDTTGILLNAGDFVKFVYDTITE